MTGLSSAEERKGNREESIQKRRSRTLEEEELLKKEMVEFLTKVKGEGVGATKALEEAQPNPHHEQ